MCNTRKFISVNWSCAIKRENESQSKSLKCHRRWDQHAGERDESELVRPWVNSLISVRRLGSTCWQCCVVLINLMFYERKWRKQFGGWDSWSSVNVSAKQLKFNFIQVFIFMCRLLHIRLQWKGSGTSMNWRFQSANFNRNFRFWIFETFGLN